MRHLAGAFSFVIGALVLAAGCGSGSGNGTALVATESTVAAPTTTAPAAIDTTTVAPTTTVSTETSSTSTAAVATTTPTTTAPPSTTVPPTAPAPTTVAPEPLPPAVVDGRLNLPLVPEVGQAVRQRFVQELEQTLTEPGLDPVTVSNVTTMIAEIEVIARDDSSYTTSETIVEIEITSESDPDTAADVNDQLASAVGVEIITVYAFDGEVIDREIIGDIDPFLRDLLEAAPQVAIDGPDGGVAVGDSWTNTVDGQSAGLATDLTTEFTLVSLDDDTYVAESTAVIDAAEIFAELADEAVGTLEIDGTVSGLIGMPLAVRSESVVTLDAELTIDGETGSILQIQRITLINTAL